MPRAHKRESLEEFARRTLLARRHELGARQKAAVSDAAELRDERETDWEDTAALVTAASSLERLGEDERAQLIRIEAALARLDQHQWGKCDVCGEAIDKERLRAVPEATRCARHTNHA